MRYMRLVRADGDAPSEPGMPLRFKAVTTGTKRDGQDLGGLPWRVDRYESNPIVTWSHDLVGTRLPIGRAGVRLTPTDGGEEMDAEITFDVADAFAAEVDRKYRTGFLHAISVSWDDVDADGVPVRRSGKKAAAHDLLEIAAVPVPGDPQALLSNELRALRALRDDLDGVLQAAAATHGGERAYPNEHACRLRDPGEFDEKSFRREERESDGKPYSVILGRLKGETTMTEQAYRYPTDEWIADEAQAHCEDHNGIDFEAAAEERAMQTNAAETPEGSPAPDRIQPDEDLWPACAAAMVDVFDRGSDDSDEKRKRAYNALLPTYRRLAKEPPEWVGGDELQALDDGNWRGLFLAGELEVVNDGARAGKVLSARNEADITAGLDAITEGVTSIRAVLERAAGREPFPPPKDDEDPKDGERELAGIAEWLDEQLAEDQEAQQ